MAGGSEAGVGGFVKQQLEEQHVLGACIAETVLPAGLDRLPATPDLHQILAQQRGQGQRQQPRIGAAGGVFAEADLCQQLRIGVCGLACETGLQRGRGAGIGERASGGVHAAGLEWRCGGWPYSSPHLSRGAGYFNSTALTLSSSCA
jgi:hypothetical protein